MFYYETLNNATREGARYAIVQRRQHARLPERTPCRRNSPPADVSGQNVEGPGPDGASASLGHGGDRHPHWRSRTGTPATTAGRDRRVEPTTRTRLVPLVPLPAYHDQCGVDPCHQQLADREPSVARARPGPRPLRRRHRRPADHRRAGLRRRHDAGERRDEQNAADAAALAGARYVVTDPVAAEAAAGRIAKINGLRRCRSQRGRDGPHSGNPRPICGVPGLHPGRDRWDPSSIFAGIIGRSIGPSASWPSRRTARTSCSRSR